MDVTFTSVFKECPINLTQVSHCQPQVHIAGSFQICGSKTARAYEPLSDYSPMNCIKTVFMTTNNRYIQFYSFI